MKVKQPKQPFSLNSMPVTYGNVNLELHPQICVGLNPRWSGFNYYSRCIHEKYFGKLNTACINNYPVRMRKGVK